MPKPKKPPIRTYYANEHWVIENECKVFTIAGAKKPNWHMRARIPSGGGRGRPTYYRRSLKTTDKSVAVFEARKQYYEIIARESAGLQISRITLSQAFDLAMSQRRESGFKTEPYERVWKNFISVFDEEVLKPEYGVKYLDQLKQIHINRYFDVSDGFRATFFRDHPPVMLYDSRGRQYPSHGPMNKDTERKTGWWEWKMERLTWDSIFSVGVEKGYILTHPKVPDNLPGKSFTSGRGFMTQQQYQRITRALYEATKEKPDGSHLIYVDKTGRRQKIYKKFWNLNRLRHTFLLMSATGIRPQEAFRLRWGMIQRVKHKDRYYTRLELSGDVAKKKWSGNAIQERPRVAYSFNGDIAYDRVVEEWGRKFSQNFPDPNGLVFPTYNKPEKIAKQSYYMKKFLISIDEKAEEGGKSFASVCSDINGNKITLNSARHWFVTQRLSQGCPSAVVALNCGHSVRVMHQIYAHLIMDSLVEWLQWEPIPKGDSFETMFKFRQPPVTELAHL